MYQASYINIDIYFSNNLPAILHVIIKKKSVENAKQILQSTEIAQQDQLLREYWHVHTSNKKRHSTGLD